MFKVMNYIKLLFLGTSALYFQNIETKKSNNIPYKYKNSY